MAQLAREIGPHDQVIVVGDGRQLGARGCIPEGDARFQYHELAGGRRGNPGRDFAMTLATGDFLMFIDDDDLYIDGSIESIVRPALREAPNRVHAFRCAGIQHQPPPYEWTTPGACFVWPRAKAGQWDDGTDTTEYHFFSTSFQNFPDGPILHDAAVYLIRPHTPMGQHYFRAELEMLHEHLLTRSS